MHLISIKNDEYQVSSEVANSQRRGHQDMDCHSFPKISYFRLGAIETDRRRHEELEFLNKITKRFRILKWKQCEKVGYSWHSLTALVAQMVKKERLLYLSYRSR